ncbi:MAG: metallophosphoesterase [Bacteroidota bacterium]
MEGKNIYKYLDALSNEAHELQIEHEDKIVIFSDLHMGDGGSTDDFKFNADLFRTAICEYYNEQGFSLVLNGDVEELQRFSLAKIQNRWKETYDIFDLFCKDDRLYKTIGNHDLNLVEPQYSDYPYPLYHAVKLKYKDFIFLVYHGHQASKRFKKDNELVGFTLKYLANPLRIRNYSVAHDSTKKYKIERRAYKYSNYRKIASIIGHTHRPLFESMSKPKRLKHTIEQLCREYISDSGASKNKIKESINSFKKDLRKIYKDNPDRREVDSLYDNLFQIPCLFNSGCVIGKRGITCLEISNGEISLIHWFDKNTSKKYLVNSGYDPVQFNGGDFYRMVVNNEKLDYIFARIKLLAG